MSKQETFINLKIEIRKKDKRYSFSYNCEYLKSYIFHNITRINNFEHVVVCMLLTETAAVWG